MATSFTITASSGSYPTARNLYVDCRSFLDDDELLVTDAGSPAYPATTTTPAGLTISSVAVTGAEVTIAGNAVAAGKALALAVVAPTAGEYTIILHVKTNASTPQTPNIEITLIVTEAAA